MWLTTWILGGYENKWINLSKKKSKKQFKGQSIWLLIFTYNKEMDQLVPTNSFIASELEKPSSLTCPGYGMTKMDDEEETIPMITSFQEDVMMDLKDEKETIQQGTPRFEMGSNDTYGVKAWKGDNLDYYNCNFFKLHTNIKFKAIFNINIVSFSMWLS